MQLEDTLFIHLRFTKEALGAFFFSGTGIVGQLTLRSFALDSYGPAISIPQCLKNIISSGIRYESGARNEEL